MGEVDDGALFILLDEGAVGVVERADDLGAVGVLLEVDYVEGGVGLGEVQRGPGGIEVEGPAAVEGRALADQPRIAELDVLPADLERHRQIEGFSQLHVELIEEGFVEDELLGQVRLAEVARPVDQAGVEADVFDRLDLAPDPCPRSMPEPPAGFGIGRGELDVALVIHAVAQVAAELEPLVFDEGFIPGGDVHVASPLGHDAVGDLTAAGVAAGLGGRLACGLTRRGGLACGGLGPGRPGGDDRQKPGG